MATTHRSQDTRFVQMMEEAAGYHPPIIHGTIYTQFGHCATSTGHARCPERIEVGPTTYVCNCCLCGHQLLPPAERLQTDADLATWLDETQGDYDQGLWED